MSSRHNPLTPSSSNLSHTLTSTHTHHQHISPHRHFPHGIQAGSGNPTAQKPTLNTSLIENYRPISLPSIHSENYDCFFHKTINWMLNSQVSGVAIQLRPALLSVTENLWIVKANSKSSVLILLDQSATFDTVNHQILLSTLSSLGITGIPICWF